MIKYFKNYFKSLHRDPFTTAIALVMFGAATYALLQGTVDATAYGSIVTLAFGVAGIDSNEIGNNNGGHFPIK